MDIAQNTFNGGLVTDFNIGNTPNKNYTSALNATLVTYNGNEQILQNDMGNVQISYTNEEGEKQYAHLPEGYIPLGVKTFGRIMYIASVKIDQYGISTGQIGSFPSPDYSQEKGKLIYKYAPLHVGYTESEDEPEALVSTFFNFDLQHPIEFNIASSYDGSVNLIFTDAKNEPKCINSGFDVREDDTYLIINRYGKNNTNRYNLNDKTSFDISTSLYTSTSTIHNLNYIGQSNSGKLMVGNYTFYAIACDKDGNESDIIAESGMVPVFIGTDGDPFSINGGIENMRTDKSVILRLKGADDVKYIKICYTRASSANNENSITTAYKINDPIYVENEEQDIYITGYEDTSDITINDLNTQYFNADVVKSQAIVNNILFQANLTEKNQDDSEYNDLKLFSLTIVPTLTKGPKININSSYEYEGEEHNSYYDSKFTYDYTGYHAGEIYRFGIVYIRQDNSLTSVFDILGVNKLTVSNDIPNIGNGNWKLDESLPFIKYDIFNGYSFSDKMADSYYNIKGVCRIDDNALDDLMDVIGIQFHFTQQIPNAGNYKGYFFVRQKRIPTLVAQGYATNVCEESFLPSINTEAISVAENGDKTNIGYYYNYESFQTCGFYYYDSKWRKDYPGFYPEKPNGNGYLFNGYYNRLFSLPSTTLAFFDKVDMDSSKAIYQFYNSQMNQDTKTIANFIVDQWPEKKLCLNVFPYQGDADTINGVSKQYLFISLNGQSTKGKDEYRIGGVFLSSINEPNNKDNVKELGNTTERTISPMSESFRWVNSTDNDIHTSYFQHFYDNASTIKDVGGGSQNPSFEWYYALAESVAQSAEIYDDRVKLTLDYTKNAIRILDDGQVLVEIPVESELKFGETQTLTSNNNNVNYNVYKVISVGNDNENILNGKKYDQIIKENSDLLEQQSDQVNVSEDILNYLDAKRDWKVGDIIYQQSSQNDNLSVSIVINRGADVTIFGYSEQTKCSYNAQAYVNLGFYGFESVKIPIGKRYFYSSRNKTTDGTKPSVPISPFIKLNVKVDGTWYQFEDYVISADGVNHSVDAKDDFGTKISNKVLGSSHSSGSLNTEENGVIGYNFDVSTFNGKYDYPKKKERANYGGMAYLYNPMEVNSYALFCPDYELNMPYYNNIFTGQELTCKIITSGKGLDSNIQRSYQYNNTAILQDQQIYGTHGLAIEEGMSLGTIIHHKGIAERRKIKRDENVFFAAKAADETTKSFAFAGARFLAQCKPDSIYTTTEKEGRLAMQKPFNLLRGVYGSYVGLYPFDKNDDKYTGVNLANKIVNIYIPNYSTDNLQEYFKIRFNDRAQYYRISDSQSFTTNNFGNVVLDTVDCYRGDCFVGWYTHRVNRNFNDSSAPYNDTILQSTCFVKALDKLFSIEYRNFDLTRDEEVALNINLGDLNAVQLGSWVTFPCRSSRNISIRSTNDAWTDEKAHSGNARSFYPLHGIDPGGSYKLRESNNYNDGFSKSGGDKYYINQNNYIWENNYYKNRIQYSDIMVNGAFQNGNRVFLANHYQDYTDQYGAIVKIVPFNGTLVVICEHGIFSLPVNERALAGEGLGGFVYINTSNVLSKTPKIISENYGTTWSESVVLSPYCIFGVDSCAKKIWLTDGQDIKLISDFTVQSFLNKALPMDGLSTDIGKVNIKTHYNSFKNDIMFTAYLYSDQNTLWNLCYNINQRTWTTFYSWIPSMSENIGNNYISFDHQVDRKILGLDFSIEHQPQDNINYLWKHGQSDFIPNQDRILPTFWYGSQHPFEIEFVVCDQATVHKIFDNLIIMSNKAKPESFHYEVVGECYDLSHDKPNIYYKQELTKALYHICLGSRIKYNPDFLDITPKEALNYNSHTQRSTAFPLYYKRVSNQNNIEDSYQLLTADGYDYQNLSGSEIVFNQLLNEFRIWCHVKGVDMQQYGRILGNMHYKEDVWRVQIPSITYVQKNEDFKDRLPINLGNNPLPDDAKATSFDLDLLNKKLGLDYQVSDIVFDKWEGRKEMRLKDKYIKIRIRYTGDEVALLSGVATLYNKSQS